mgnify:CR=1 FL=1
MSEQLILALNEAKQQENYFALPEEFISKLIFSSISFDDPSFKEEDVTKVLKSQFTGVSAEKVQKITNQKNALYKVIDMAKNNIEMTENNLKDIHQILCDGTNIVGGLYRNVNISVKGSNHTPCSHEKVYDRMDKYFAFLADEPKGNLMEYIAYAHVQLAKIHPFLDCNGRLARLVLNYELIKHGFIINRNQFNVTQNFFRFHFGFFRFCDSTDIFK